MNVIKKIFKKNRVVLPVIHVAKQSQALKNMDIALQAGADGVFLISHSLKCSKFLPIIHQVRHHFPTMWLGVNFLDRTAEEAFEILPDYVKGYWSDYTEINEDLTSDSHTRKWNGTYFGGVAFKYQSLTFDVSTDAKIASKYVDVITTSGDTTGQAPSVEKIECIRKVCPNQAIAIASGITFENVTLFMKANAFLVATGISDSFTELNKEKTKKLIDRVNFYEQNSIL